MSRICICLLSLLMGCAPGFTHTLPKQIDTHARSRFRVLLTIQECESGLSPLLPSPDQPDAPVTSCACPAACAADAAFPCSCTDPQCTNSNCRRSQASRSTEAAIAEASTAALEEQLKAAQDLAEQYRQESTSASATAAEQLKRAEEDKAVMTEQLTALQRLAEQYKQEADAMSNSAESDLLTTWAQKCLPHDSIVCVTTDDCPPCKLLAREVLAPLVAAGWRIVYVSESDNPELTRSLKTSSYPTVIGFRGGVEIGRTGRLNTPQATTDTIVKWWRATSTAPPQ